MSKKRSAIFILAFFLAFSCSVFLFRCVTRGEDAKFETYTEELFRQEAASGTITLHYTLKNPEAYNVHHVPVTYGSVSTDKETVCAAAENALASLRSFHRSRLSSENRLTYDVLESYLTASLAESEYLLYEEPLAPLTGTQSQLPILLSEYEFYDIEDCETYLKLLKETPEYFRSIASFEEAKSREGLFMSSRSADGIIEECLAFTSLKDKNYLYSSFEERLSQLDLTDDEKEQYEKTNDEYLKTYVFPAYEELADALEDLRTSGKNENGLHYLPEGDSYYECVVAGETGSSRSIPELQSLTRSQMADDLTAIQEVLESDDLSSSSDLFSGQGTVLSDSNPESILVSLQSKLSGSFPAPPAVNTQIKYIQKDMEEYFSPAFYMIPPIDNSQENVIYINQGHIPDDLTLFTTLAHEGYPGHLYQTTYYASTDPAPIRNLLGFGGYTEGWATYSEMLSYYYADIPKEQAVLLQHNASLILGLYALADMGIHYDGWTLADTVSFFHDYGIGDTDTIKEIYDLIIGDPGNYLKYYIGYVEFLELKKDAIRAWKDDFSQERFHKLILETGPAPFDILREKIQ